MSYPLGVLSPVPTAVPPKASSERWESELFRAFKPWFNCET